jgi:hypothetical protein
MGASCVPENRHVGMARVERMSDRLEPLEGIEIESRFGVDSEIVLATERAISIVIVIGIDHLLPSTIRKRNEGGRVGSIGERNRDEIVTFVLNRRLRCLVHLDDHHRDHGNEPCVYASLEYWSCVYDGLSLEDIYRFPSVLERLQSHTIEYWWWMEVVLPWRSRYQLNVIGRQLFGIVEI